MLLKQSLNKPTFKELKMHWLNLSNEHLGNAEKINIETLKLECKEKFSCIVILKCVLE